MNLLVPLLAVSATVINKVDSHLKHPFIDEVFHLRQCAVFCAHNFASWDPKITTPPGLYLLGTAYAQVLKAIGIPNPCGPTSLRFLNVIGGGPVLYAVLGLYPTRNYRRVNILSLPLLYTYNFLFYTDVWSTVLVVAALMVVLRWPNGKGSAYSNVLGFLSLWFRQTNIVWILFLAVLFVDIRRQRQRHTESFGGVARDITSFVRSAFSDWLLLIPFAANGLGFLMFLIWNGGITFGDKENHQVCLHFVQVLYCVVFMAFFTIPVWISPGIVYEYGEFCGISGMKKRKVSGTSDENTRPGLTSVSKNLVFLRILATLLSYGAIAFIIKNFSVVHPFLLADNRHYTFYIYRRILSKSWSILLMTPAYHFCTWLVVHLLKRTRRVSQPRISPLTIIAFLGAMAATLIPSPLFEPRYFIIPLTLFRIFIVPVDHTAQRHLVEFTWYTMINVMFFVVFFSYEFTWFSEPGLQRIIW